MDRPKAKAKAKADSAFFGVSSQRGTTLDNWFCKATSHVAESKAGFLFPPTYTHTHTHRHTDAPAGQSILHPTLLCQARGTTSSSPSSSSASSSSSSSASE